MKLLTLRIPLRAATSQNWRGLNPFMRAAIVKRERKATAQAFHAAGGQPVPEDARVLVKLVRIGPNELDDDNLRGALKAVRDELALQLGFSGDRDARLRWDYDQRSDGHVRFKDPSTGKRRTAGIFAVEVLVGAQACAECWVEHCSCIHGEPCSDCDAQEAHP